MSLQWNLTRLFESFDDDAFIEALSKCEKTANAYTNWIDVLLAGNQSPSEKIERYIKNCNKIKEQFGPVSSYSSLSFSTDTGNNQALEVIQKLQGLDALMVVGTVKFEKWLLEIKNLDSIIETSPHLKEHQYYLTEIIKHSKYTLTEDLESMIAQMRNTGSHAWSTLQDKISSNMIEDVEIDGKIISMPLTEIRNLAMEKDPIRRKTGYEAEMRAYKKNEEWSAAALNGIKGESLTITKLKGYTSPLEQTLISSKMNQETLDAMLGAMKDALPKFREYYKKKAELLGHKNGLPFYELFAPMGESDISFPYKKGKELVLEQFKGYSLPLYNMAKKAFDEDWIDVEPRKGKSGGAFCASIRSLKESRILLNYTGKLNNAVTLAHELGHAYHNLNLFEESALNQGSPMPLAETASIFCETVVKNAALKEADEKSRFGILEVAIQGYSQVIVDIYSRFIFESNLFEARKNGSLSPDQISQLMLDAQKECYGDGLDPEVMHPYMWMNKPHYYISGLDFYNFPYAFGLLFAKGLYAKYKSMGEAFVPKLDHLLSSTNKMDIVDVAKLLDVDVTSKAFWQASLNEIGSEIDQFISLC